LNINNENFKILLLPFKKFNFYEIKSGYDKNYTKILHFRISKGRINKNCLREIIIQIKLGPLFFKIFKIFPKKISIIVREIISISFISSLIVNPFKLKKNFLELANPYINYIKFKKILLSN
jgi:hypothetical protein